jgi:hypothetical protein
MAHPATGGEEGPGGIRLPDHRIPFGTRATEIVDPPTAAIIIASLAKPAVEARLTDRAGKVTVVRVSAAKDGNAYVRIVGARRRLQGNPESFVEEPQLSSWTR